MFKFRPQSDLMIMTYKHDPTKFSAECLPALDVPMVFTNTHVIMQINGKKVRLGNGEQVNIFRYRRDTNYRNCIATTKSDQFAEWLKLRMHSATVGGVTTYTIAVTDPIQRMQIFGFCINGGNPGHTYQLNDGLAKVHIMQDTVKIETDLRPIGTRVVPRGKRMLVYCKDTSEVMLAPSWLLSRFCGKIPTAMKGTVELSKQPLFDGLDVTGIPLPDKRIQVTFTRDPNMKIIMPHSVFLQYFEPILNSQVYTFKQLSVVSATGFRSKIPRIFGMTTIVGDRDLVNFTSAHGYTKVEENNGTDCRICTLINNKGVTVQIPYNTGALLYTSDLCFGIPTNGLSSLTPLTAIDFVSKTRWCETSLINRA